LVAEKFAIEGSNIAINYVSNEKTAQEVAANLEKEFKVKTFIIQGVSFL
jgi:hypothetical protein